MTVLFTGFPGFLGSRLLPRLASRTEERILCLVQPKFARQASEGLAALRGHAPLPARRVELVEGDVTLPGLVSASPIDAAAVREIWHLAAIYDLSVPREPAHRVNVEGTRNVLEFAARAPRLERLHYVSTCYVSGRHAGVFRESDLDVGQRFNNHYEETKFLAEVEVRRRASEGLPVTVYRPAVVVGDSETGETQKYDGPYYVIRWILKQRGVALLPVAGRTDRKTLNVVPRDWLIEAIDLLSRSAGSKGKTYHLADPDPPSIQAMLDVLERAAGRRLLRIQVPLGWIKRALEILPFLERLVEIPPAAIDYFDHPTIYDTTEASRDLASSGLRVPRFADYGPRLVEYVRAHPSVPSEAMA